MVVSVLADCFPVVDLLDSRTHISAAIFRRLIIKLTALWPPLHKSTRAGEMMGTELNPTWTSRWK
jgi:hypothetical protein